MDATSSFLPGLHPFDSARSRISVWPAPSLQAAIRPKPTPPIKISAAPWRRRHRHPYPEASQGRMHEGAVISKVDCLLRRSRTRSLCRRTPVLEEMLLICERTVLSVTPAVFDISLCVKVAGNCVGGGNVYGSERTYTRPGLAGHATARWNLT